jgi:hypothetical protein
LHKLTVPLDRGVLARRDELTVLETLFSNLKNARSHQLEEDYTSESSMPAYYYFPRRHQHNMATKVVARTAKDSTAPSVITTELDVIDYERLNARDEDEIQKLIHAATTRGIFFLDTSGPSAAEVMTDIPQVLNAERKFFALSLEEKRRFESSERERG